MAQDLTGLHLATTWNAAGAKPTAKLEVEWSAGSWTDETSRLLSFEITQSLYGARGLPFLGENRGGTMDVVLENHDGRYSPHNSAGPLYAYIANGLRGFPIRLSAGYYYGTTPERLRQFTGYIDYPAEAESLAQNRVSLSCLDNSFTLQQAALKTPMYVDQRTDQVIASFLTEAGFAGSTALDHGISVIPWAWGDAEDSWAECQVVARSEGGVFYAAKDGTLRFERFTHWIEDDDSTEVQVALERNRVLGLSGQQSWRDCYSGVRAQWIPRAKAAATALYTAHEPLVIRPGQTLTHEARYRYPAAQVYVPSAALGDYTAFSAGMSDLSAQLDLSATLYGSLAELEFTNNSTSQTIYVLDFRIRGIPLIAEEAQVIQEDSTLGIVEDKVFDVPTNDYVQSAEQAHLQASFLRDMLQRPRDLLAWSGPCAPWLELSDRASVTSAPQGLSELECYVLSMTQGWAQGAIYNMTLELLPVANIYVASPYFRLGSSAWADVNSDYLFY